MFDEIAELSLLYDFYGNLLTDKQREYFELHHEENLSLTEIADNFAVSKQTVSNTIKKAEEALRSYEDKLGLLKDYKAKNGL